MGAQARPTWRNRFLSWHEPIGRRDYVVAGLLLMTLKFAIDWCLARFAFGRDWTPGNYIAWLDLQLLHAGEAQASMEWVGLALMLASLPFIWIGILLTVRRVRSTGQAAWCCSSSYRC
ncbi:MAG: hypothetical protein EXS13_00490 [Planctomycetes bacterium]|nr:hypothetical protein [Planctomycetota bacterium]